MLNHAYLIKREGERNCALPGEGRKYLQNRKKVVS